jgi:hypothetical protein
LQSCLPVPITIETGKQGLSLLSEPKGKRNSFFAIIKKSNQTQILDFKIDIDNAIDIDIAIVIDIAI